MTTDERLGTFAEILGPCEPAVRELMHAARALLVAEDPDTHEVPRTGERAISYGVGPSKMKQAYCYLMPQRDSVNLGFFHGAGLPDPDALLTGTGKSLRHVKLRSPADLRSPALRRLVQAAIADR